MQDTERGKTCIKRWEHTCNTLNRTHVKQKDKARVGRERRHVTPWGQLQKIHMQPRIEHVSWGLDSHSARVVVHEARELGIFTQFDSH